MTWLSPRGQKGPPCHPSPYHILSHALWWCLLTDLPPPPDWEAPLPPLQCLALQHPV